MINQETTVRSRTSRKKSLNKKFQFVELESGFEERLIAVTTSELKKDKSSIIIGALK